MLSAEQTALLSSDELAAGLQLSLLTGSNAAGSAPSDADRNARIKEKKAAKEERKATSAVRKVIRDSTRARAIAFLSVALVLAVERMHCRV